MQASAVYALPTVFQDLKDPQVRLDLCASLQQLDTVIADVFKHIKDRVRMQLHDQQLVCPHKYIVLQSRQVLYQEMNLLYMLVIVEYVFDVLYHQDQDIHYK